MGSDLASEHRASVLEEIRLIILEALRHDDVIHPELLASIVSRSYPESGLTEAQIAAGMAAAAAEAGVQTEVSESELLRRIVRRAQG